MGSGGESHFEVFFPQAGRTLFHTTASLVPNGQIVSRVEENGPISLGALDKSWNMKIEGTINPGPADSLDRYRALMNSTAVLRCW